MVFHDYAAWGVIVGLSLMVIGGLVLWAYGTNRRYPLTEAPPIYGAESEAARAFHTRLVRWFLIYGCLAIAVGAAALIWSWTTLRWN